MEDALVGYLNVNSTYAMEAMRLMIWRDFGVYRSTSTISTRLPGQLYTVKQVGCVMSWYDELTSGLNVGSRRTEYM